MSEFDLNENNPLQEDTNSAAQETTTCFQDELRKNMRPKEDVEKELEERIRKEKEREKREMEAEAMLTLQKIKEKLLQNVKAALYTTENGVTTVSCSYDAPSRFLSHRWNSNSSQLAQNNKAFILFRDPTLRYQSWDEFYVTPKYTYEYDLYSDALKRLAAEENISIEFFVSNVSGSGTPKCPFPSNSRNVEISKGMLRIQASTVIHTEFTEDKSQPEQPTVDEAEQGNNVPAANKRSRKSIKKTIVIIVFAVLIHVVVGIICWNIEDLDLVITVIIADIFIAIYHILKK